MKSTRTLRMLTTIAVLSVLAVLFPALPALAAEEMEISPDNGEIGDKIDVTGTDLIDSKIGVDIYFSSDEADMGDEIDDEVIIYKRVKSRTIDDQGEIDTFFYVPDEIFYEGDTDDPEAVIPGYYFIYLTYEDDEDIEIVIEFTVRGIELDISEGKVGTEVEITGIGFDEREDLDYIKFDDEEVDIEGGDEDTDGDGEFQTTILIPEASVGEHTITVRDDGRNEASATFTIEPEMAVSPTSGEKNSQITVSGAGFGSDQTITISFDGSTITTDETDEYGSFTASFTVPDLPAAIYDIEVEDEDENKLETTFTMTATTTTSISPVTSEDSPANLGTDLSITGIGFQPSTAITITDITSGMLLTTVTSDAEGSFQATFSASGSVGQHIVNASDGINTLSVSFVLESQAPAAPSAVLPLSGTEVESQPLLDWEDAVDPSGVTYTIQLATSSDFGPASLILEKAGLKSSEYIITEEQALEASEENAPYYWRVKAIDGVQNEGEWSTANSFHVVGSGFQLSSGVQYALMGVGGLVLLALGFFLGRRTSYSSL